MLTATAVTLLFHRLADAYLNTTTVPREGSPHLWAIFILNLCMPCNYLLFMGYCTPDLLMTGAMVVACRNSVNSTTPKAIDCMVHQ